MADHTQEFDNLSPVKQAMLQLKDMRRQLDEMNRARTEPIAIIGMGMRFPGGVNDPKSYWQLLRAGGDAITSIPGDRWDIDVFYDADSATPGKMYTRGGGFIEDIGLFDAPFFNIAPREAINMDPQQRLLLQVSWDALENAGQAPDQLYGTQTGVFVAISNSDYGRLVARNVDDIDVYYATGNTFSVASGRLSYFLGLKGPSVAIDTACSGSLVAVHLACQSLRNHESSLALAGGVNLILSPEGNINFSKAQMLARNDRCKTFDAAADGYVRGEGCGIVVLKRLSDALANGDPILALIRGSAVNQDGRSSGLTAPNGPSQEAVIRQALANARLSANQVDYIEAHGTGTSLGDPIEVQALAAAMCEERPKDNPLMIGSVKTNVGHLEAAAGVAGLMKTVLALQHREIPPHLHLQTLNPRIPWEGISVSIPTQLTPWQKDGSTRFAGVSSFGFSGTNAHVILEEAPDPVRNEKEEKVSPAERPLFILNLSAKRVEALKELAHRFDTLLSENEATFRDICFTSNVGRAHLIHRLSVIAGSAVEAQDKLTGMLRGEEQVGVFSGQVSTTDEPQVSFLFTGHGSQYLRMGRQLFETQPTFRAEMERCEQLLESYLDHPLLSVLYPASEKEEAVASGLMDTMTYAQPALFALEYSLAKLWLSWGIEPAFVMGHSVGEYAAACIAGAFSLADGLKLVAARGRLMDSLPHRGKMVTVFAEEAHIAEIIAPYAENVSIAVVNGPTHVVISGTEMAIQTVTAILQNLDIKTRDLAVAQAAHSPILDPILDEFEAVAAEITYARPEIGVISSTTGQLVIEEIMQPGYWRRHLRETVRFEAAMQSLEQKDQRVFLEIGPHPTLLGMGRRCLPDVEENALWLPSMRKGQEDWQEILESLAALHVNGFTVDWAEFERPYGGRRTQLPTYPWAGYHYWIDQDPVQQSTKKTLSWDEITLAGRKQAQQAPLEFSMKMLAAEWEILDQLTKGYILQTLRTWNLFIRPGEAHTVNELMERTKVLPNYSGLISRWLNQLAETGLVAQENDRYISREPLPEIPLTPILDQAEQILDDGSPLLEYVKRCGEKMIPVLTGKESPLETLFPEGSYATVDYLYHHWPLIQYFNGILRAVVEALVHKLPAGKKLRILEIGAGTGGSTAALLPSLPSDQTSYQFTDLSDFFLARAQERFQAYPFMQYGTLDIERDPEAQGYSPHSADVIIAANALHATHDLAVTLANVKKMLAPGGFLLLLEGTKYLSWLDITTSLIEGWERFDDEFRGDNPLLSAGQWQETLKKNGFAKVASFPEEEALSDLFVHNIILAQEHAKELRLEAADVPQAQSGLPGDLKETVNAVPAHVQQLREALPSDRKEFLVNYVRGHVASILRLGSTFPIGPHDRLMDVGLDSLMAVELRSRLGKGLQLERPLSATLVFDHPTIEAIAKYLERELFGTEKAIETVASKVSEESGPVLEEGEIMDLSDEEIEALLLKKFEDEN